MGAGGGYSYSYKSDPDDEFEKTAASFDCKDTAIIYAAKEKDLVTRRGYIVFAEGFTEHWWCAKVRKGTEYILDLTAFAGTGGEYRPLKQQGPTSYSDCDAMVGKCKTRASVGPCDWCAARSTLEKENRTRLRLKEPGTYRFLFDRLMVTNTLLRTELAELKGERERVFELESFVADGGCRKCRGAGGFWKGGGRYGTPSKITCSRCHGTGRSQEEEGEEDEGEDDG